MYRVAIQRHDGSTMFLRLEGDAPAWTRDPAKAMKLTNHERAQATAKRRGGYVVYG